MDIEWLSSGCGGQLIDIVQTVLYCEKGLVCTHTQPLRNHNGVFKLLASGTKQAYLKDQTESRPSDMVSHHPECLVDDAPPQQ